MSRGTLDTAVQRAISCTGLSPSLAGFPKTVPLSLVDHMMQSTTPRPEGRGLASFPFARRYLGNHSCFLLLSLLRCFNSRRFPPYGYFIHHTVTEVRSAGFPHSDTHGSLDFCSSPWLFAALCVLLRLLVPRHSPFALFHLTRIFRFLINRVCTIYRLPCCA